MTLKNILITKVFQKDIPKLQIILQENIPEENEVKLILSYLRGLKDKDGRIRKYFLAKNKTGKILGCMAYAKPDSDLKKYFKVHSKNSVELLNCFVSKKYQGYGAICRNRGFPHNRFFQRVIPGTRRDGA